MRFNFTYFRKHFTDPIVNIINTNDIHEAIRLYNIDPEQLTSIIYEEYLEQIDENTWYYSPTLNRADGKYVITNENSNFFNINLYLSVNNNIRHAKTHHSKMPLYIDLVEELLFPQK